MALKPRTGNQYAISAGEWSAVVTELGASLRELKWRGEDIIVPFDPDKVIPCCNGWVLAPYPNRVTNGQYSFDGEDYQMPIDEFGRQSSLHGYAYRYVRHHHHRHLRVGRERPYGDLHRAQQRRREGTVGVRHSPVACQRQACHWPGHHRRQRAMPPRAALRHSRDC